MERLQSDFKNLKNFRDLKVLSTIELGGTFSVKAEHMVLTPELTDSLALINMRAPAKERHIIYGLRLALTSK